MLLTGVRTAEIRHARHEQFDLESRIWSIPASSVKQLRKRVKVEGDDVPDYLVPSIFTGGLGGQVHSGFHSTVRPASSGP